MQLGMVKWFDDKKGFGFIVPDHGGSDVFVHHSVIESKGFRTLQEGQRVEFESKQEPKGLRASRVRPITGGGNQA